MPALDIGVAGGAGQDEENVFERGGISPGIQQPRGFEEHEDEAAAGTVGALALEEQGASEEILVEQRGGRRGSGVGAPVAPAQDGRVSQYVCHS